MITIEFSDSTVLNVGSTVIERLDAIKRFGFETESGGILLGRKSVTVQEYYLDEISLPSKKDERATFYFIRNAMSANKEIRKHWKRTKGIVNYLGEWHTHNELHPFPSLTDKELMRQIVIDKSNPLDRLFMIILGNDYLAFCGVINPTESPLFYDAKMIGLK